MECRDEPLRENGRRRCMPPRRLQGRVFAVVGRARFAPTQTLCRPPTMSNKQRLVLSVLEFLNQSNRDGTVKQDDQESLEVASASRSLASARERVS